MITKDGQSEKEKGELTGKEVAEIIKASQDALLASLSAVISENSRRQGRIIYDGSAMLSSKEDTEVSLADIAKAMVKNSDVEGTNIGILGKERKIEENRGDADRTVDLLGEIP
jgi:hypothetical protein